MCDQIYYERKLAKSYTLDEVAKGEAKGACVYLVRFHIGAVEYYVIDLYGINHFGHDENEETVENKQVILPAFTHEPAAIRQTISAIDNMCYMLTEVKDENC